MAAWLQLTEEQAQNHPKFGLNATVSVFRAITVLATCFGLMAINGVLSDLIAKNSRLDQIDYLLALPYITAFIWSGINEILISKRHPAFIKSFIFYILICPALSLSSTAMWAFSTGRSFGSENGIVAAASVIAPWGLWALIWIPYLLYSTRINVTLLRRIRTS